MNLENKKIFITGGSSGLGKELVISLLNKGCIVRTITNNKDSVDILKREINSDNFYLDLVDVSNAKEVEDYFSSISDLDVVINNAGVWLEGDLEGNSIVDISRVINVNLTGLIHVTSLALPLLKKKEISYLINISSTSGIEAKPNSSVYSATKWGVHGFTECLKTDLKGTGVRVVGVYPGGMKTKLFRNFEYESKINNFMEPKEVADVIIGTLETSADMVIDHLVIKRTKY